MARYKEDLEWLGPYKSTAVIYNKGGDLDSTKFNEVLPKAPIGYESHSYFCYIVDHYDRLPDVVVFIQGRIDDHLGDIQNQHSEHDKKNPLVFLDYVIAEAAAKGISAPLDERPDFHGHWRLWNPPPNIHRVKWTDMNEWWTQYIGLPWPGDYGRCCWCHLFAVRKDKILQHSKEFYIRCRDDPDFQFANVEVAHFWERMFFPLFSLDWKGLK